MLVKLILNSFVLLYRDVKNIQRRNLNDSLSNTLAMENFALKNRMSIQGQWNSENLDNILRSGGAGSTNNNSKRTGQTDDIVTEEDFSGNPQVRSKDSVE